MNYIFVFVLEVLYSNYMEIENEKIFFNQDVKGICRGLAPDEYTERMLQQVEKELILGFEFIKKHQKVVTVFGSARPDATEPYYEVVRDLTYRLTSELGLTIATGGGPGVMEAANRGSYEADKTKSISMAIELPHEQEVNQYTSEHQMFRFFFTRKVIMTYATDAFIVCPGGYGTLNEFFEILTLVQTRKMPAVPIILFGKAFWEPLKEYIDKTLEDHNQHDKIDDGFISPEDELLFIITDSADEVVHTLKRMKVHGEDNA